MARWQGTLSRGSNRIQDVVEPRETTRMYVLILVRVLIRIGMLDHATRRLRFLRTNQAPSRFSKL